MDSPAFFQSVRELWYFTRTGQVRLFAPSKKNRFIGPNYLYYDGPHYTLGLWWININWYGFKDHIRGMSRIRLISLIGKLLNKRFF